MTAEGQLFIHGEITAPTVGFHPVKIRFAQIVEQGSNGQRFHELITIVWAVQNKVLLSYIFPIEPFKADCHLINIDGMFTKAAVIVTVVLGTGRGSEEIAVIAQKPFTQCFLPLAITDLRIENLQKFVPLKLHIKRFHNVIPPDPNGIAGVGDPSVRLYDITIWNPCHSTFGSKKLRALIPKFVFHP